MYRTDFWTLWEKPRMGCFKRIALKHVYYLGWNRSPAQGRCMRQVFGPGALGRPRGIGWRGRWEGVSGWGIHVYPWHLKKKERKKTESKRCLLKTVSRTSFYIREYLFPRFMGKRKILYDYLDFLSFFLFFFFAFTQAILISSCCYKMFTVLSSNGCLSHSVMFDSLWLHGLKPSRILCPWGFSRQ